MKRERLDLHVRICGCTRHHEFDAYPKKTASLCFVEDEELYGSTTETKHTVVDHAYIVFFTRTV